MVKYHSFRAAVVRIWPKGLSWGLLLLLGLLAIIGYSTWTFGQGSRLSSQASNINQYARDGQTSGPIVMKSGDLSLRVTKKHVGITEAYNGATWSDDSRNVYFSKYVKIELLSKTIEELQRRMFMAEVKKMFMAQVRKVWRYSPEELSNGPSLSDFTKPLYKKVLIFRYNIIKKQLDFLTSMDVDSCGYPVHFFFRDSLDNNTLQYADCEVIHMLDLKTLEEKKVERVDLTVSGRHFAQRRDRVRVTPTDQGYTTIFRYLSPDRHAFIQIKKPHHNFDYEYDLKSGFSSPSDAIGIFSDSAVEVKTWEELGWGGGIPRPHIVAAVSRYQPHYFVDPRLMRSPEEKAIRSRLQID